MKILSEVFQVLDNMLESALVDLFWAWFGGPL